MLKILHIIPTLKKGGAERLALDICIELSKRKGVEICLVALSGENDYSFLSDTIHYKVIPSKVIPSITGKPTVQIEELMSFIKSFNPDVIHSHLFEADLVSRWQLLNGVKYYSHCHDNMHQLQNFKCIDLLSKKRITELYEKWLIIRKYKACNNQFFAISKNTQKFFIKVLPASLKKNIYLLTNAIVIKRFKTYTHQSKTLELISIGRLDKNKNHHFLFDVVSLIKKYQPVHLTICGDGSEKKQLNKQLDKMNLHQEISLVGNVDYVENYLSKSTIYVHAALSEAMGLTLLEAMASGLPVVTLNGGGNADIMENGKNGFIIDDQNPALFAEKILEIWRDKELYKRMSFCAQEYAKQYDIKPYCEKLFEFYKNA